MTVKPDFYENNSDQPIAPSRAPFAVIPHATNALPSLPKALYVGTAGDIVLRGVEGAADVTFKAVPAGTILPVQAQYVRVAGTTAADIVGLS